MPIVAKFKTVDGESKIAEKAGWIDISHYAFSSHIPISEQGEGFSAGAAEVSPINFSMYTGKHTPDLNKKMLCGTPFDEIVFEELAQSGQDAPKVTFRLTLKKGYLTGAGNSSHEGTNDRGMQSSDIKYEEMKQEYFKQDGKNWVACGSITYNTKTKKVS